MENRTYLWLFLTIDITERSPSNFRRKSDIESLLSSLPAEISDAYDIILERSTDNDKARILFECHGSRPAQHHTTRLGLAWLGPTYKYRSFVYLDLHSYYSVHTGINAFGYLPVPDIELIVIAQRPLDLREANMALAIATQNVAANHKGTLSCGPQKTSGLLCEAGAASSLTSMMGSYR